MVEVVDWAALINTYINGRKRRGEIGPLTARNIRSILGTLAACGQPVPGLRRRHVEKWLETMDGLAPATRRSRFSVARGFLDWTVREGMLGSNPMATLRAPRTPRSVPRAMPGDRVTCLLGECPDARARLIVILMVQLGLRCCEVATVQRGDIDWSTPAVRIVGKGGHQRVLPLTAEAIMFIDDYLAEVPGTSGPLIRSATHPHRGIDADTVSGLVSRWMSRAGVKRRRRDGVSAHALRHTAATDMLRSGAHVRDVQQVLGHAHLATTEIYLPLIVDSLQRAVDGRTYAPAGMRVGGRAGSAVGERHGADRFDAGNDSAQLRGREPDAGAEADRADLDRADRQTARRDVMPAVVGEQDAGYRSEFNHRSGTLAGRLVDVRYQPDDEGDGEQHSDYGPDHTAGGRHDMVLPARRSA